MMTEGEYIVAATLIFGLLWSVKLLLVADMTMVRQSLLDHDSGDRFTSSL